MAWALPEYSRAQVDKAGGTLVAAGDFEAAPDLRAFELPAEYERALVVINNWRSAHSFPLNTFQVTLRRKAAEIDDKCLVAQRIKRLSSIELKLRRFPSIRLAQMQDIGGCRAVVGTMARVRQLVTTYKRSDLKHQLVREDDYVSTPPDSGYRGVHLVYRYRSPKKTSWNALKIEMQFRSLLQHAWATAVETVGTFTKQALKSTQGDAQWLRFFSLMGSAIARRERTPDVPGTPQSQRGLLSDLRQHAKALLVEDRLNAYGAAIQTAEDPSVPGAYYFLLRVDPSAKEVNVRGYPRGDFQRAVSDYLDTETRIRGRAGAEAVLVSVGSVAALRRAYPNYFLDTQAFIQALQTALRTT